MENNSLVVTSHSVQDIKDQIKQVHQLMKEVMVEGEHYGVIPGTKKKSLYKQGAEKLSMMFRLAPEYVIERVDLENGHLAVNIVCKIVHIPSQTIQAQGVGSCSTMESKFRYRNVSGFEITDEEIPKDAKENKAAYRAKRFGMQKTDEGWKWVKYKSGERQENPDIADVYNTVLKMGKKRAHVDAVLTATAASDIFTQDFDPDEDPPPETMQYQTLEEAIKVVGSYTDLIELEKVMNHYKNDYDKGVTGWNTETWSNLCDVMKNLFKNLQDKHSEQFNQQESDQQAEPEKQNPNEASF